MRVFGGTFSPVVLARKRLTVIAVASRSGAGKGTVCKLLADKLKGAGNRCLTTSSSKEVRIALGMSPDATRESIRQRLASCDVRPKGFPLSLFMPLIAQRDLRCIDLRPDVPMARIVDGVRMQEQYDLLHHLYPGATLSLLWVDRHPRKCVAALAERDQISTKAARDFIKGEMTGHKPLVCLQPLRAQADYHIDNNGTIEQLERAVERYVDELLGQLPQANGDAEPDRYGESLAAVWIRNHPPTGNAA